MTIKQSATTQYKLVKETSLAETHKYVIYFRHFEDKKWYKKWKWKSEPTNFCIPGKTDEQAMKKVIDQFIERDNSQIVVKSETIEL